MRSQFKGHFSEPQEKIDELWESATFVFDANVLLNLYRYSDKAQSDFLRLMTNIQERSWLPEQCVHEFLSNRLSVIRDQMTSYSDTEKKIGVIRDTFAGSKGHPFVSEDNFNELEAVLDKIVKNLKKNRTKQEEKLTKDNLKDKIANLFEGRVGPEFSDDDIDEIFILGEARYREEIPPGYKDGNKNPNSEKRSEKRSNFGDFILWRQTMDWAKTESRDVILVTDDRKEDWWLSVSGKTVSARPELVAEFNKETNRRILFYNPDSFLKLAQEKLGISVSDKTINEIRQEHDSRSSALARRRASELSHRRALRREISDARDINRRSTSPKERSIFDGASSVERNLPNEKEDFDSEFLLTRLRLIQARRKELEMFLHEAKEAEVEFASPDILEERALLRVRERELLAKLQKLDDFPS